MPTTQKQNVPALRFSNFSSDWIKHKLGKIYSKIVVGFVGTVSTHYCDESNGVQFIRTLNIKDGYFSLNNIRHVTESFHKTNKKSQIKNGDILIARVGANMGMVCKVDKLIGEANSANVIIIKHQDNLSSDFYALYLASDKGQRQICGLGAGGAQEVLNISVAKTILVPCITLKEQKKIASFLTSIDTKIKQLGKKKSLLEQYKKGVMQKLFSQELRFKDEKGNDFPDWEEKKLGGIAKRITTKNSKFEHTRVLTNSAIHGVIDQRDYFDNDIANSANLDGYYIINKGDFVYNPRISVHAPVGPIKRNNLGIGVMSPLYSIFRFNSLNTIFFEYYFQTVFWHKYMYSVANYGARYDRMAIYTKDFMNMPLPLPSSDEQEKIANFLNTLDQKIELITIELKQAQTFKKGLLQQMFI